MKLEYDLVSDTLYIDARTPYEEQDSDEIAAGVIARSNPDTGEIENLEVLHFHQRSERGEPFDIPVSVTMRTAHSD